MEKIILDGLSFLKTCKTLSVSLFSNKLELVISTSYVSQPTGMHLRRIFETSYAASQRHLEEG